MLVGRGGVSVGADVFVGVTGVLVGVTGVFVGVMGVLVGVTGVAVGVSGVALGEAVVLGDAVGVETVGVVVATLVCVMVGIGVLPFVQVTETGTTLGSLVNTLIVTVLPGPASGQMHWALQPAAKERSSALVISGPRGSDLSQAGG